MRSNNSNFKMQIIYMLYTYLIIITTTTIAHGNLVNDIPTTTSSSNTTSPTPTIGAQLPPARLPPPPRVKVNKCCHYNEILNANKECIAGNSSSSSSSSALWVPQIYLINRRTYYLPKGRAPNHITFNEYTLPSNCELQHMQLFVGSSKFIIFSNGSLFLPERAELIAPHRFCVDLDSALVCNPLELSNNTAKTLHIRKCCGQPATYDDKLSSCIFGAEHANVLTLPPPHEQVFYKTIYGFPDCPATQVKQRYAIVADVQSALLNAETGQLTVSSKNLSVDEYCLEHLHANNAVKIFTCLHHFGEPQMTPLSSLDLAQTAILNAGLVISVIFLAATLVAGYMMPSAHHLLHWRCQIYYVFCLFIGDFLLAYSQLNKSVLLGSNACLLLASAMHFFFLSAFFWLNTMCFNIWWTFRDFRPTSLERNQELLRLRLYSAYAWGIPLVIAVIACFVDQLEHTSLLQPGFGLRACWFNGQHLSEFAYFFGPVGILLCINIVLFISTTHMLTCGLWKRDDIKSTTEKTALGKVCLKLVVVMGVTWIADIISWLVGGPDSNWFFTDLINALQGVFIFIVVGCQPQVWTAFKRCCWPSSRQEITNTTNGVQHSSSSQGLPSMAACGGELTQNTSMNTSTIGSTKLEVTQQQQQQQTKIPMETVC